MRKRCSNQINSALPNRLNALEIIHAITTAFDSGRQDAYDQIVLAIADTLKVPLVMIHEFNYESINPGTQVYYGRLSHIRGSYCAECLKMNNTNSIRPFVCTNSGPPLKADCFPNEMFKAFLGAPILSPAGTMIGVVCVFDVYERKFSNDEGYFVEHFARYLTNEFARKRREYDDKKVFEQDLLIKLASGITHDVRNRLHGIFANTEALFFDIGENSELLLYKEHIRAQVHGLSILMEDLMSLARPIRKESICEVPISSIVSEVLYYWQKRMPESVRKVNLTILAMDIAKVKIDMAQFRQALIIILKTAHEHSIDDGEMRISVSLIQDQWARIRVATSGTGMPSKQLLKAFDPYYIKGKANTGLDLSIVKHIIECHGGTVSMFTNDDPAGFTIDLSLPLSKASKDFTGAVA